MIRRLLAGAVLAVLAAGARADSPWEELRAALEGGDARAIASMVGGGRVSLSLDGIAPGSYTSSQALHLLRAFFGATSQRRVRLLSTGEDGTVRWAEVLFEYRMRGGLNRERVLLELCQGEDEVRLCGIRSASPPAR